MKGVQFKEFDDLLQPTLSQDAADAIAEEYSRLRSHEVENPDVARTQPVTARALETLIRLSTAHARARLSKVILIPYGMRIGPPSPTTSKKKSKPSFLLLDFFFRFFRYLQ